MDYTEKMLASMALVEKNRDKNIALEPRRMTSDEKDNLLRAYHPDYREDGFANIRVGVNAGERAPRELAALLEGRSRVLDIDIDLSAPDIDTDVLIIGGGGAGASAAIEAARAGANVTVVTKLRMGDANTMMAEGGIQAADKVGDSPARHYLDVVGGGHYANVPELVKRLVMDGPAAIEWLISLGVEFDRGESGEMLTTHGGGTSAKRMHAARDYTGAEIMRTLRDEVMNMQIPVVDFTSAVELIKDTNGRCCGAVLMNMETGRLFTARAKCVILATGGAGRVHYQSFPTSNHYGATADGLVLGYRAGARLIYQDTLQYHPTGTAFPSQIFGALVTEKVRSLGAKLVNRAGEAFVHPLETRDVAAAAIIRECAPDRDMGLDAGLSPAVWLDTPMIDMINGVGTLEKRLPAMLRMFLKYGIDMRATPILVYPTLHYQNGGLAINEHCETDVPGLYAAGEVSGGVHGRNRLMGNSLLDVIVFGRIAGIRAAQAASQTTLAAPTLTHVRDYAARLNEMGVSNQIESPMLLPDYTRKQG